MKSNTRYISAGSFADAEAADGIAGKIERHQPLGAVDAQLGESRASLHDGEQSLIAPGLCRERPLGPADCPLGRVVYNCPLAGQSHHMVQHHRHVNAQLLLDGDHFLRRQFQRVAVEMRAKGNPCSSTCTFSARLNT